MLLCDAPESLFSAGRAPAPSDVQLRRCRAGAWVTRSESRVLESRGLAPKVREGSRALPRYAKLADLLKQRKAAEQAEKGVCEALLWILRNRCQTHTSEDRCRPGGHESTHDHHDFPALKSIEMQKLSNTGTRQDGFYITTTTIGGKTFV